jgi:2-methylcitrate dehydratase PrpD
VTAIEGRFGFLRAYSGDPDPELLLDGLGDGYAIDRTALKYHPCNYYIQSVNDSVLEFVRRGVRAEDVESVLVHTMTAAVALVCEPLAVRRRPAVMIDAQFSVPFNVALGLLTGRVAFRDFTPQMFGDPAMCALMDRVEYRVDPDFDRRYPVEWPGRVDVLLRDGSTESAETLHVRGDPRNPLSLTEVVEKHHGIVADVIDDSVDDEIISLVADFDQLPGMRPLTWVLGQIRLD